MIERAPPKLALWLLKVWGSPYRNEALAGDLIEQYQEGRSRAWYWRQVVAAILGARWRFIRTMPWTAFGRQVRAAFRALLLTFGAIALGAGTLTWADTLRGDSRPTPVCVCPDN
jgi:hypothetical protein